MSNSPSKSDLNENGGDSNIQTFLRIRPSKSPSGFFRIDDIHQSSLHFNLPENYKPATDYVNNTKLHHSFHFHGIIPMTSTQDDVFKRVGADAVRNALEGYNSTIFAYGQTGSGKTYTLTGEGEKYVNRGIIPRSLTMLFNEIKQGSDNQFKFYISYMEIYNEKGYDLLTSSNEVNPAVGLDNQPKVTMLEDEFGNFHLKNLSLHPVDSEEEALDLLYLGDTNRAVAETPMNLASSRSHCIFTISIEARKSDSEKVRRSKLHLVDLAGSERVAKTNSSGVILQQARYINSSLFYLEMVIVALYEKATKGRSHIPYRNSMMTSALRDSLGGNCKTIMIATINPEASHTDESLSTCRFAQRVSLIKNKAVINEDVDPSIVIRKLKNEMLSMREEIGFLKGEAGEGQPLTPLEIEELKILCREYCDNLDPTSVLNIGKLTLTKIKDAFAILKNLVLEARSMNSNSDTTSTLTNQVLQENDIIQSLQQRINDLTTSLLQREHEIAVLVNMNKKDDNVDVTIDSNTNDNVINPNSNPKSNRPIKSNHIKSIQQQQKDKEQAKEDLIIQRHLFGVPPPNDKSIFDDAAASFEWFRERCSLNKSMEENRELLKDKITEAKVVGERANQSRKTIDYLKTSIESIRRERVLNGLLGDNKIDEEESSEESSHRQAIEQEKVVYKESFEKLKILKPEIEHIRKILENCRMKMQSQFDEWYNILHSRNLYDNTNTSSKSNNNLTNGIATKSISSMTTAPNPINTSIIESSVNTINRYNLAASPINLDGEKPKKILVNNFMNANDSSSTSLTSSLTNSLSTSLSNNKYNNLDDVNDDIQAFYQAKEELLKRKNNQR